MARILISRHRERNVCRGCGCDDDHACVGIVAGPDGALSPQRPCHWVLLDIGTTTGVCSACAWRCGFDPRALATMGTGFLDREDEEAA